MRIPLLLVWLFLLSACNRPAALKEQPSRGPAAPPSVKTTSPTAMALERGVDLPGTIIAEKETALYVKLPGYVEQYLVDIGRHVKGPKYEIRQNSSGQEEKKEVEPGEVMAELSIPELHDEARQKRSLVKQSETELEQSRQMFEIAKENVKAMNALADEARAGTKRAEATYKRWESEWVRVAKLVKERALENQIGDETENQLRSAAATQAEAAARVVTAEALARKSLVERDKAQADIKVAEAKLQVARSEAERLEDLLQYTKIRAPFDGVVTKRRVDTRHFVQPLGNPKAEALFTVMKVDTVRVVIEVPEADAVLVKDGDAVRIVVPALKGMTINGKVARTSGSLDPVSRTMRVEADLPNPDEKLQPGTFVQTRIVSRLPKKMALPAAAVVKSGDEVICYRLEGDRAVRMPIEIGRGDGSYIEVLKKRNQAADGWEEWSGNEIIIANNAAYLSDGQTVQLSD